MIVVGGIIGFSLFPKADTPNFLIAVHAPDGSSLAETDKALRFVETKLAAMPEVQTYFSNLGHGNPKIYYNEIGNEGESNYGDIFVKLRDYDPSETPRLLDGLRQDLKKYPNARIYVREFQNGPPINAPIEIRVVGDDLDTLYTLAARVEKVIKETPGSRDVEIATVTGFGTEGGRKILEASEVGDLKVEWRGDKRPVPEGARLVRTDQPLGAVAVYLCEPESDDGAIENGLVAVPTAGDDYPIWRVG